MIRYWTGRETGVKAGYEINGAAGRRGGLGGIGVHWEFSERGVKKILTSYWGGRFHRDT